MRVGASGKGFYENRTLEVSSVLSRIAFPHTCGNDAPRGGASGFYVVTTNKALIARRRKAIVDERADEESRREAEADGKRKFTEAVHAEANSLIIDDIFISAIEWANKATGLEKSDRMASAMKGLLSRNNIEKVNTDFWQVFRIVKANSEATNLLNDLK